MKKSLFLLLYLFAVAATAVAQHSFPVRSELPSWNELHCSHSMTWQITTCTTNSYFLGADTTICGTVYTEAASAQLPLGYVRVDGARVYGRFTTDCSKSEFLIYDFSISPGDTILCGFNGSFAFNPATKFWLTRIDTASFFGTSRRVFHMRYQTYPQDTIGVPMTWVEGIGSLLHPFYSFFCITSNCETDMQLLCYSTGGTQHYQNPQYSSCFVTITGQPEVQVKAPALVLVPNPALNTVQLKWDELSSAPVQVTVLDALGRLRSAQWLGASADETGTLDLQGLTAGLYFVQVQQGPKRQAARLLID